MGRSTGIERPGRPKKSIGEERMVVPGMTVTARIASLACLLVLGGCAKPFMSKRANGKPEVDEFTYALPRTVVAVKVRVSQKQRGKSRCALDAAKAESSPVPAEPPAKTPERAQEKAATSGAPDGESPGTQPEDVNAPKASPKQTWKAIDLAFSDFEISTVAEPDPAQVFTVKLDRRRLQLTQGAYELGPDGVLHGASANATHHGAEIAIASIQAVATVAAAAVAAMIPEMKTVDCAAEEETLEKLRENRKDLLLDAASDVRRIAMIDAEIKRLEAYLRPAERIVSGVMHCRVRPTKNGGTKHWLWTVREHQVVAVDRAVCDAPYDPEALLVLAPRNPKEVSGKKFGLEVGKPDTPLMEKVETPPETEEEDTEDGKTIYYRTPSTTPVWVYGGTDARTAKHFVRIAQHGEIASFPAGEHFKKMQVELDVELHPETGSLKNVTAAFGRKSRGAGIKAVGTAAGELTEGVGERKKQRQAEDAAAIERSVEEKKLLMCLAALERGEWSPAC
jgi:hypothetical protein